MTKKLSKSQQKYEFQLAILAAVFSAMAVLFLHYYTNVGQVAGAAVGF